MRRLSIMSCFFISQLKKLATADHVTFEKSQLCLPLVACVKTAAVKDVYILIKPLKHVGLWLVLYTYPRIIGKDVTDTEAKQRKFEKFRQREQLRRTRRNTVVTFVQDKSLVRVKAPWRDWLWRAHTQTALPSSEETRRRAVASAHTPARHKLQIRENVEQKLLTDSGMKFTYINTAGLLENLPWKECLFKIKTLLSLTGLTPASLHPHPSCSCHPVQVIMNRPPRTHSLSWITWTGSQPVSSGSSYRHRQAALTPDREPNSSERCVC